MASISHIYNDIPVLEMLQRLSMYENLHNRYILIRTDVKQFEHLVSGYFRGRQGDFNDISSSIIEFPAEIPKEQLDIACEFSKTLNISGERKTETAFFDFDLISGKFLRAKLMIMKDGKVEIGKPLENKSTDRASVIASLLIAPFGYSTTGQKLIGLYCSLDTLDAEMIEKVNDYFCNVLREKLPDSKFILFTSIGSLEKALFRPPVNLIGMLTDTEFIQIKPAGDVEVTIRTLAGSLQPGELTVFFLGAGASFESKIPMGDALLIRSLGDLLKCPSQTTYKEMEERFWHYVRTNNSWLPGEETERQPLRFERVLLEQIKQLDYAYAPTIQFLVSQCKSASPSTGHIYLGEALDKGCRTLVVTTNLDTLAEEVIGYYRAEPPLLIADPGSAKKNAGLVKDYMEGKSKSVPVVKLHGTIDYPETINASTADTRVLDHDMKNLLSTIFSKKAHLDMELPSKIRVIFCGYSFRDADVWKILEDESFHSGIDPWIVDPFPRHQAYEVVNNILSKGKVDPQNHIITTTFDVFMDIFSNTL